MMIVAPFDKKFFHHEGTKDTKGSNNYFSELRALRVLRGEMDLFLNGSSTFQQSKMLIPRLFAIKLQRFHHWPVVQGK